MATLYPIILIIHLFCAIIFVGYLFFDVIIYPNVKKMLGAEIESKVSSAIAKRARKIMPTCVLLLLITGLLMLFRYVGFDVGFFHSNLQKLLMIKVFLACLIFIFVAISLSCAFIFKCRNPLSNIIHPLALSLAIFIIIFAKLMFYI
ncbi:copper resistance protein CopD [Helicobacter sp. 16-1353]|uniref:copper resistance protein CopD n=1 Tax=Helicobacter sp. 16-1353 TaxID=2004996 RepID=UPI000DCB05BE|nr:copper resistance protein CopD [Helicobacter sp. 16-1353]RAX54243.1 copper resistance protein CopD [Helicobacter sp. 16-1353]